VHQPDGSFACLPAWMLEPAAARFEISAEPHFSVDILRALRREIDALLGFLSAESKPKETSDGVSERGSIEPVRREAAAHRVAAKAAARNRSGTRKASKASKTSNNGGRS
jgi:hypothetical protein